MSVSNREDSLELEVSSLGPIVEAKVDLRPFTLFVGPSNTGKSYLAIMIYALHRLFSRHFYNVLYRHSLFRVGSYRPWMPWRESGTISESKMDRLLDWTEQFSPDVETFDMSRFPLPDDIAALVRPLFESVDKPDHSMESEIIRCFGLRSAAHLIRSPGTTATQVVLRSHVAGGENPFVYKLDLSRRRESVRVSASIPSSEPLWLAGGIESWWWRFGRREKLERGVDWKERSAYASEVIDGLAGAVFPYIAGLAGSPAHYLPADRTGVMHAHRVVVSALIERAASAGIRPASPVPMLSGVLADFLEQLIALSDLPPGNEGEDLAARLEKTILGGAVRHEGSEGRPEAPYPSFSYHPDGWRESLPLMRASSMVSELAPVVLYLRHVVRPGDVLIIEEPESHLHPAMQVEFTRLLAAAVGVGVRIIMTTHSEWVLEELANLVRLSALPDSERKTIDGGDAALKAHEVGAWLFEPKRRPRGSVVREIPLDSEAGTFAAGYEDVAAVLHNRWAEISSRSKESEH